MHLEDYMRDREKLAEKMGETKGKEEGKSSILELIRYMEKDGISDKIPLITSDPAYREEMLKRYQLQ